MIGIRIFGGKHLDGSRKGQDRRRSLQAVAEERRSGEDRRKDPTGAPNRAASAYAATGSSGGASQPPSRSYPKRSRIALLK